MKSTKVKLIVIIAALALSGCSSSRVGLAKTELPEGELLVSIELIEGALSGRPQGRTGFFFYVEDSPGIAGPRLTGYLYINGEIRDLFGGGSGSASVIKSIRAVGLEPFDFMAEVSSTAARLNAEAEARGERFIGPMVLDGAKYEIVVHTPTGPFRLKEWNPGPTINTFAPHNAKIAKLKALLDILALYYGRGKFGV